MEVRAPQLHIAGTLSIGMCLAAALVMSIGRVSRMGLQRLSSLAVSGKSTSIRIAVPVNSPGFFEVPP